MRTFSVEGTSSASMEEAMANAMAQAASAAGTAKHMDIAVRGVVKMDDGSFRVTVHVIAHEEGEELTEEDETGGDTRSHDERRKRAEEISQQIKEDMEHQFYVGAHAVGMSMDEAIEESMREQAILEESVPDTLAYTEAARRSEDTFDTVEAVESTPSSGADNRNTINVLSREVDEIIGLLSGGFYEPPQPEVPEERVEVKETPQNVAANQYVEPGRRADKRNHPDQPELEPS